MNSFSEIPIKCILALDENNGIANENGIPWNIKEDLKLFKEITTTCKGKGAINVVMMGKKTFNNIGKVLPNRLNIVLTSNPPTHINMDQINIDGPVYFKSHESALDWLNEQKIFYVESIFIIGGKSLYEWCLNEIYCNEVYITKVNANYKTNVIIDMQTFAKSYKKESELTISCIDHNNIDNGLIEIDFLKYVHVENARTNKEEQRYLNLMKNIITHGSFRPTRNANTFSLFGKSLEFDLKKGFPLLTTKKMFVRGIFEELKFFLLGKTNTKELENKGINIWKGNTNREFLDHHGHTTYEEGDMGPMYGFQLLHFGAEYSGCNADYTNKGHNQLSDVLHLLKTDKFSRRILMTTYNPAQSKQGVLYPCHGITIQFGVEGKDNNELVCTMYQRSVDSFLGLPFNIASYSLLVHIICNILGNNFIPGRLVMFFGDIHVYEGHMDAVKEQLANTPNRFPWLKIKKQITDVHDICNLEFSDIDIIGYNSYGQIKAEMYA